MNAYGSGYGYMTRFILGGYGTLIAVTALNAFIFTTLDAATRIGRYILEELFKGINRYVATLIIVASSGWLALGGGWQKIWPVFGSANQLIAALTLLVLSSWFLAQNKHARFTLVPAIFMLVTTLAALAAQLVSHFNGREIFLFCVDILLIALALAMVVDVYRAFRRIKTGKAVAGL